MRVALVWWCEYMRKCSADVGELIWVLKREVRGRCEGRLERIEVVRGGRKGAWRRVFIVRVRVGGETVVEVVVVYRGLASSKTVSEVGEVGELKTVGETGGEGVETTFTDGGTGSIGWNWGVA